MKRRIRMWQDEDDRSIYTTIAKLVDEDIERIARRVVELIRQREYLIGEQGPEWIVPSGAIIPNRTPEPEEEA